MTYSIPQAYQYCLALSQSHYENFPVASYLLPKHIRKPIAAIYAFARTADDFADEGYLTSEKRLQQLDYYIHELDNIQSHASSDNPIFIALKDTITHFNLPIQYFYDLILAFKQDVTVSQYENFQQVLEYCKYSANPVGRLLLHLTDNASPENLQFSDAICTGLQLINFLQDIYIDLVDRNRCYLPQDELSKAGISIDDLKQRKISDAICHFVKQQEARAADIYLQGFPLGKNLKGLFGFEIRLVMQGGAYILNQLQTRASYLVRPTLKKAAYIILFIKACRSYRYPSFTKEVKA